jgi:hypothetical protein
MNFNFSTFFLSPGGCSGGAFGVENAKTRGSGQEMPKTGSPLAKGERREPQRRGGEGASTGGEDISVKFIRVRPWGILYIFL